MHVLVYNTDNPWDLNKQKVDQLKHMMVIKKINSGKSIDIKALE